ncbi:MAG: 3-keto-disaccharide hydrolase, partial [Opitutaceae bacterium]
MKRTLLLLAFSIGFVAGRALASDAKPNTLTAAEKATGWKLLFDGKTLEGWKASENQGTFTVQDGELVVFGKKSHLFYQGSIENHNFKNFELKLDIKTYPKANSGVYVHTQYQETGWPDKGYEVQVNNTHKDVKKGAGLYAVKDNFVAPAKDGEWYTMTIKVEGKRVQTFVNGKQVVDYTEEPNPVRPP